MNARTENHLLEQPSNQHLDALILVDTASHKTSGAVLISGTAS